MGESLVPPAHASRIVVDAFRSPYDPRLSSWLLFRSHVLPDADGVEVAAGRRQPDAAIGVYGVWRLLASNNRELGRCAALHLSPSLAVASATQLQADAVGLTVTTARGPRPMTHAWVLRRTGQPVIIASRWYESAGEATAAARAAAVAFAGARFVEGVSVGSRTGRRRRHALPVGPLGG